MASEQVERLLHDMASNEVVPVTYSRKSLPFRVMLLMTVIIRAVLGRR